MKQVVLDAAPLIGLFYTKDTHHEDGVIGFDQLSQSKTALITPIPIIFEVYKWILQRGRPDIARSALRTMNDELQILPISDQDFEDLQVLALDIKGWQGSLEDATVVLTAVRYRCPVWTYNFRDFAAFKSLRLWNP